MDFDEGEPYLECQEDELEDTAQDRVDAMKQASAWGMGGDMEQDERDGMAAGSAEPVTPVTPPPLPILHSRKRTLTNSSSPALSEPPQSAPPQRRRLLVKTPGADVPHKPVKVVEEFGVTIDGVPIDNHPLYKAYVKMNPDTRRLISKKGSQHKYRVLEQLKKGERVFLNGMLLKKPPDVDWETFRESTEHVLFQCMARDEQMDNNRRGYAMSVLVAKLKNDAFPNTSPSGTFRITGLPAILLTYIGDYGLIDVMTVSFKQHQGVAGHEQLSVDERWMLIFKMSLDEVASMLKEHPTVRKLAKDLETLGVDTCNRLHTPHWSMSVEVCGKTLTNRVLRVHGHLWVALKRQTVFLEQFKLPGTAYLPYVNWTAVQFMEGKTTRSGQSGHSGNLYTCIDKIGQILKDSTIQPWVDYPIRDSWLTNLYASGKISYQTAKQGYINTVHRVVFNLQALEVVHAEKQGKILQAKVMRIEREIRATFRPWKTIDVVLAWQAQYATLHPRYDSLVLDGDSKFGKTWYALSLNALGKTLYSDCTSGYPNLKEFNSAKHDAILLDEITPKCAISIKKTVQASNELVTLGSSPTMCNAYKLHLHRVQIICCSNVWMSDLKKLNKKDAKWLMSNCRYVNVTEALWT